MSRRGYISTLRIRKCNEEVFAETLARMNHVRPEHDTPMGRLLRREMERQWREADVLS